MADSIRGKHYEHLPTDIQKGIVLHRAIDTYTDIHPVFRQSTKRLHERYHHYSGVIVDVFYDHFLAKKLVDLFRGKNSRILSIDFISRFKSTMTY